MLIFDVDTKEQAAAAILALADTREEAVVTWHHKVGTKPTVYHFPAIKLPNPCRSHKHVAGIARRLNKLRQ